MEQSQPKEWFENWFDTPFYHQLYKDRNEEEAQYFIDKLFSKIQLNAKSKVLDIACGMGRHSTYLERKGFEVTGIDLSENSIRFARQFESPKLSFFKHDMRDVFRVNYFDCALNLFTSLGYFKQKKDNEKVIQSAAINLKPNGMMIIDFFNASLVKKSYQADFDKICDETVFHISKKIVKDRIIKTIRFEKDGKNHQFQESVTLLELVDFEEMFKSAGIRVYSVFGNYQLDEFEINSSPRLIILGKKVL